jgi:hypothetical protein
MSQPGDTGCGSTGAFRQRSADKLEKKPETMKDSHRKFNKIWIEKNWDQSDYSLMRIEEKTGAHDPRDGADCFNYFKKMILCSHCFFLEIDAPLRYRCGQTGG